MVQGVLQRAVEWQYLQINPARVVRKPGGGRRRVVHPLPPIAVERMRAWLLDRDQSLDALLVVVMAYAGLRPGEALALQWDAVGDRRLLVSGAVSMGEVGPTKTRRIRTVQLLEPLVDDLNRERARRSATKRGLVFPSPRGRPWTPDRWRNWRRRTFRAAAEAAGLEGTRPYDLRHSYVSLLIAEGRSVLEVARQAGHSPLIALNVYGHVFDEHELDGRRSAVDQIRSARDQARSSLSQTYAGIKGEDA
jgi:integrase